MEEPDKSATDYAAAGDRKANAARLGMYLRTWGRPFVTEVQIAVRSQSGGNELFARRSSFGRELQGSHWITSDDGLRA